MSHLFTAENAAEYGRKGALASLETKRAAKQALLAAQAKLAEIPASSDEQNRINRIQRQIDKCDEMLDSCDEPETFVKLTAAKERLWNLLFPKAGVLKPKAQSGRRSMPNVSFGNESSEHRLEQ